jgi:malonate-semialdehyde dehydrogenase (acetylating)/methylmalonate-semialdehyde dehydrogenase
MSEILNHWINGQAVAGTSGRTADVFNPALGEKIAEVPLASVDEVAQVVAAACAAAVDWAEAPPRDVQVQRADRSQHG